MYCTKDCDRDVYYHQVWQGDVVYHYTTPDGNAATWIDAMTSGTKSAVQDTLKQNAPIGSQRTCWFRPPDNVRLAHYDLYDLRHVTTVLLVAAIEAVLIAFICLLRFAVHAERPRTRHGRQRVMGKASSPSELATLKEGV